MEEKVSERAKLKDTYMMWREKKIDYMHEYYIIIVDFLSLF